MMHTRKSVGLGGAGAALASFLALAPPAAAQTAPAATSGAAETSVIDEVVVTSRRRSEALQDVPIAVTVLTQQDIEARGVRGVADIVSFTPNVNFNQSLSLGSASLTIRGQTQDKFAPPPAAIVVDGVLQISPAQFNVDEFDLAQVEVLKGPQGAIYGKNAIAGALNMTTTKPDDTFRARVLGGYARGQDWTAKGSVSGPVVPGRVYVLGGLSFQDRRGQVQNVTTGHYSDKFRDLTGRLRVVVTPTDTTELDLKYTHAKSHGHDPSGIVSQTGDPNDNGFVFDANRVGRNPRLLDDLSGRFSADLGFATASATLAAVRVKEVIYQELDYSPLDFTNAAQNQLDRGFSQEFRLTSRDGERLRWMVGAYHVEYKTRRGVDILADPFLLGLSPVPLGAVIPIVSDVDNYQHNTWAVFGDVTYDITSELSANVQIRRDRDRALLTPGGGATQRTTFAKWQPKGTLTYKPSGDLTFYASIGQGFRLGDFNPSGRTFGEAIVRAETATTYEAGAKTRLLDGRLLLNAAVFDTELDNAQFKLFDLNAGTNVGINIDKTRIRGLEVEGVYRASDILKLSASVGYTDAKVRAFTRPAGFVGSADIEGNRPLRTPEWTANLGLDLTVPMDNGLSLFFRPDYRYTDPYFWDPQNVYKRRPEHLVNLRVGVSGPEDAWSVTAYVRNAANQKITPDYQPASVTGSLFGTDVYYPPVGAIYGVELGYRF